MTLSNIEERFLDISGRCVVEGIEGLPEAGIGTQDETNTKKKQKTADNSSIAEEKLSTNLGTNANNNVFVENDEIHKDSQTRDDFETPSTSSVPQHQFTKRRRMKNNRVANNLSTTVSFAESYKITAEATCEAVRKLSVAIENFAEANLELAAAARERNRIENLKLILKFGLNVAVEEDEDVVKGTESE